MVTLASRFSPSFLVLEPLKVASRLYFIKTSPTVSTTSSRNFSVSPEGSTISLKEQLAAQIDSYENFLTLTNQEKINKIFEQGLMSALKRFEKFSSTEIMVT